jgi:hypothetical protein
MTSDVIAVLVDKGITVFAGLFFTLMGFRIVGKKPGESASYDEHMSKFGRLYRIVGPMLIIIGVVLAVVQLSSH